MIPVYIFTCDKYLWALKITLHLYQKYWNWPVVVFGFSQPEFPLPGRASFRSMGNFADFPAGKWSDAVISAIKSTGDKIAVILLEDYWLTRRVNVSAISSLATYMGYHGDIGRADLVTDRLYAGSLVEIEPWGELDIITNDPPQAYTMSTQASVWNIQALVDVLKPGESAWEAELNGTSRMIAQGWKAIGTRQCPARYIIGVQQGKVRLDGGYQVPAPVWNKDDLAEVTQMLKEAGKL